MLNKRIIPKMLLTRRRYMSGWKPILCVTKEFDNRIAVGDPVSQAKIYESCLADELVLLAIDRENDSWEGLLSVVHRMSSTLATPLTVGGGVRSVGQIQQLLNNGADKVVINSKAIEDVEFVRNAAKQFGSQCIVISVDTVGYGNERMLVSHGKEIVGNKEAIEWIREVERAGAGEILLTAADRDGKGIGLDLEFAECALENVDIPVILSGGCGTAEHFVEGLSLGASGVAAGSYFSHKDQNPMQCRAHVRNAGFAVRSEI